MNRQDLMLWLSHCRNSLLVARDFSSNCHCNTYSFVINSMTTIFWLTLKGDSLHFITWFFSFYFLSACIRQNIGVEMTETFKPLTLKYFGTQRSWSFGSFDPKFGSMGLIIGKYIDFTGWYFDKFILQKIAFYLKIRVRAFEDKI